MMRLVLCLWAALTPGLLAAKDGPTQLKLQKSDRVVLLGGTFFERAQSSGFLETELTARHPDLDFTFRNLGWSADTVFGSSRPPGRTGAVFGSEEQGFQNLLRQVNDAKPTVIIVSYGFNESFEGAKGLERFRKGVDRLLGELSKTKARIAIVAPHRQRAPRGGAYPLVERHRALGAYRDALRDAASDRGLPFVDLFESFSVGDASDLDHSGIHLRPSGYRTISPMLADGLVGRPSAWSIEIDAGAESAVVDAAGARVTDVRREDQKISFSVRDFSLPAFASRVVKVAGLSPGRYALSVDHVVVRAGGATDWSKGLSIKHGPEFSQREALRETVVRKNRLYFHRWRPRNVAFLTGERNREQVPSHGDVPKFTPLVEAEEKKIHELAKPKERRYILSRLPEKGGVR